jgi:Mrp family chromosome partitioning ATPase
MSDEGRYERQNEKIHRVAERIGIKLLVMSGKGGVGKSSVAVNLAVALAERGERVGLLDVDLHGPSVPRLLGVGSRRVVSHGGKILPIAWSRKLKVISMGNFLTSPEDAVVWRGPLKTGAIRQFIADAAWGDLDFLLVDSPPGTGDEPMTVLQSIPGACSIIVTTPQAISIDDVRKSISFCRTLSAPVVGVIENMSGLVCPRCGETIDLFGSGGGERLCEEMEVPFLGRIPIDPEMVPSGDSGRPLVQGGRTSPASRAFEMIADLLQARKRAGGGAAAEREESNEEEREVSDAGLRSHGTHG